MASLLHDIRRGASPKTEDVQQIMQVDQGSNGHPRCAEPQPCAGGRIEHPTRHDDDDARCCLDMDDLTVRPPLAVLPPQAAAMQRVPAIMDDYLSPDMGRMAP
jgi:hypothetical protein